MKKITKYKKVEYTIRKSQEPDEFLYIVFVESETERGYNCGRIFKGTYESCEKVLEELEKGDKKNARNNKTRIQRRNKSRIKRHNTNRG